MQFKNCSQLLLVTKREMIGYFVFLVTRVEMEKEQAARASSQYGKISR